MIPDNLTIDPRPVAHLPLIGALVDRLQIVDVVDRLIPPDPRCKITHGECVKAMILNLLFGRVALYSMEEWLAQTDTALLFGLGVEAGAFNDTRLAGALDAIWDLGTERILSEVVQDYLLSPDAPGTYTVHQDNTSIVLHGAYDGSEGGPTPARGYSKDHRPDLKQLVYGLALHGPTGMPLAASMFAGNTSDAPANRLQIDVLAELLPEEDEVTIVGDCKLVDAQTIGQLLHHKFHFVSLLPGTYTARHALVESVRAAPNLPRELARTAGRTKSEPDRVYRGCSFELPLAVQHGAEPARDVPMRFVVVESSQLEEVEEAAIERRLTKEAEKFEAAIAALARKPFACADDASAAAAKLTGKLAYHVADVTIEAREVTLPRARRGRPAKGEVAPTTTEHRVVFGGLARQDAAVAELRFHARHFVLVTDHLDQAAWPDERVLAEYRHQHIIEGHTGFRWLKNVAHVAPMFLHTPERMAALGLVLVLGLMVRNYAQFELRAQLAREDERVPDRLKKPTQKPTLETAMIPFVRASVIHVLAGEQLVQRRPTTLPSEAKLVLRLLRVDEAVFAVPRERKFTPAASEDPEM